MLLGQPMDLNRQIKFLLILLVVKPSAVAIKVFPEAELLFIKEIILLICQVLIQVFYTCLFMTQM